METDNNINNIQKEKLKEFPIEIQYTEQKGRYITASKDLEEYEVVFRGLPYDFAVLDNFKKRVCDWCLKVKIDSDLISHFPQVYYCSDKCKESSQSSEEHGDNCSLLKKIYSAKHKLGDKEMLSIFKMIVKIASRLKREQKNGNKATEQFKDRELNRTETVQNVTNGVKQEKEIQTEEAESNKQELTTEIENTEVFDWNYDWESTFADIDCLISHRKDWSKEEIKAWSTGAKSLCAMFPDLGMSEDFIIDLVSRIASNTFGLWIDSKKIERDLCFGRGLYPLASFFNHSCAPNCYVQQDGAFLSIYAKEQLPKGTELCIQYINVNVPTTTRRQELLSEYRFQCKCDRCEEDMKSEEKIKFSYPASKQGKNKKTKLKRKIVIKRHDEEIEDSMKEMSLWTPYNTSLSEQNKEKK